MNDLVTEALRTAVGGMSEADGIDAKLERLGLQEWPAAATEPAPSLDEMLDRNRGSGGAVSEELRRGRRDRW